MGENRALVKQSVKEKAMFMTLMNTPQKFKNSKMVTAEKQAPVHRLIESRFMTKRNSAQNNSKCEQRQNTMSNFNRVDGFDLLSAPEGRKGMVGKTNGGISFRQIKRKQNLVKTFTALSPNDFRVRP